MYAIIEDSGTQIKVSPGDVLDLDLRDLDDDATTLSFDRVLMVSDPGSEGSGAAIGRPYVEGASVQAEVVGQVAGDKIDVFTYKRRKGNRRKMGHRQRYLRVKITDINAG